MSTLYVDNLQPNLGTGVSIPGHVIQVVQGSTSTHVEVSGDTYTDTGLSGTITPKKASSKILVIVAQSMATSQSGSGSWQVTNRILRGSTEIIEVNRSFWVNQANGGGASHSIIKLDSPNTTDAITYTTQARNGSASGNFRAQMDGGESTITLMEIAQ